MNRPLRMFVLLLMFFVGAVQGQESAKGPRLSEAELLASLDPNFAGLNKVIALRDAGRTSSALSALAGFVRARQEPGDSAQWARRNRQAGTAAAERVLKHQFTVGGITHTFGPDIDWGFNPTTAPGSKYEADHEWTWQLNRHGDWATLARAYRATGDERFAKEFDAQFADWVSECPVPVDAADQRPYSKWRTIEAGIRMFSSWPTTFAAFRTSPSVRDETLLSMVKSMIEHGRYLRRYPTTGNWLTMEMDGLYHVGALLPFVKEAKDWRDFASMRLLKELDTQVYPDGAQIELTPGYHNVALGSFLGPVDTAAAYGYALPEAYRAKLEKMFAYNLWIMRPDRDAPRWNDSWHVDVVGTLSRGLVLFPGRQDFRWIVTDGKEGTPPDHTSHLFPYAGQVVMRSGWEREALFLGFEAGPFGYGHQHEDKLSVVIFAYGKDLLVEGGSYAYDASKWRRYVLTSAAHNVVLVDGQGQARGGQPRQNYVTDKPLDLAFRSDERYDYARGVYDEGFGKRDQRPARHTREVLFLKPQRLFVVRDTLETLDGKPHSYETVWHLDVNAVDVDTEKGIVETHDAGANLRIVPLWDKSIRTRVVKGQETPTVQGWMPLGHGIRGVRPIPTVVYECHSPEPVTLLTVFQPLRDGPEDRVVRVSHAAGKTTIACASGKTIETAWPPD
ncbi:MAG: heparinase II/III family protein [Planctomycetes bacterium]|nr:heparinase II/III family protein [Planctomycetota bacterium]